MQYDIRLRLHYDYDRPVAGGRHHIRVVPSTLPGAQRVVASSLTVEPKPAERTEFTDFFRNGVTSISIRQPHGELDVRMSARVNVDREDPAFDVSPDEAGLREEMRAIWSLAPEAPHHFLASSEHAAVMPELTAYARSSFTPSRSVLAAANDLSNRIHADFKYDGEATTVATLASDAFALKGGVCQDFTHVMLAGLRGIGIPAAYVSGFLRTIPPPGKVRLEGADAMHAWVRVWCGREAGWQEFDPTNGIRAGNDHITVGYGRDYSDVAPIVGRLKIAGGQVGDQSVDVIPVGP